jgi:hypothetical protein
MPGMSGNRRRIRLQLGVSRKLTVIRWTKAISVGEIVIRLKADEGAEKSCRKRRRRRGQRIGKKRSRVGKTRLSAEAPRPKSPNSVSNRRITNQLRLFDYAEKKSDELRKLIIKKLGRTMERPRDLRIIPDSLYLAFLQMWRAFSRRVPVDEVREHCFGRSCTFFLEKHTGSRLKDGPQAVNQLLRRQRQMREDRVSLAELKSSAPSAFEKKFPPKFLIPCEFCGVVSPSHTRTVRCFACDRRSFLRAPPKGPRGTRRR